DVAPTRRLDQALRRIASGAVQASHKSKATIAQCLADEILKAAKNDMNSAAFRISSARHWAMVFFDL
ncbi:MAG TPA: hypothetical protein VNX21_09660, partial [Candidatus Thermoplasmatota archaeon]|nr:hypothetical protein [Candidatus Thermoplasmatota archaeon]